MILRNLSLIVVVLAAAIISQAQFRRATCEVQPLWVGNLVRSSNFGLMGTFEKDGEEGYIIRSFPLQDTKLIATVGVSFASEYSKKPPRPYMVRLAITVSENEEKWIFERVESSEPKLFIRRNGPCP